MVLDERNDENDVNDSLSWLYIIKCVLVQWLQIRKRNNCFVAIVKVEKNLKVAPLKNDIYCKNN